MIYCSNCKAPLKEEAKFCTQCGTTTHTKEGSNDSSEEVIDQKEGSDGYSLKLFKLVLGFIAIMALFFIIKSFTTDISPVENSFSTAKEMSKLTGQWHDPTGVLLGDKEATIQMRKSWNSLVGADSKNDIDILLTPMGHNVYNGKVNLRGVDGYFDVSYYEQENKLVFFSTLTKSSWYLKKL
jgi:hypothetical protein